MNQRCHCMAMLSMKVPAHLDADSRMRCTSFFSTDPGPEPIYCERCQTVHAGLPGGPPKDDVKKQQVSNENS